MTCIVGVVENGIVTIGGDSQTTSGWVALSLAPSCAKVFRRGPFLIGVNGSSRIAQIVRYRFQPTDETFDVSDAEFMATHFVDEYRRVLKEGGVAEVASGVERAGDNDQRSGLLVGYRGRLYSVWSTFQVDEYDMPYAANGCGWEFALGSLHTTEAGEWAPRDKVRLALEAASRFSTGCGGPFVIEELAP